MYEVIIVGAGPAGSYLAYLLSRQGINVLLLEKERQPRYKPCGGGISPKVVKLLDFDLSPVLEDTVYTICFTHRLARPVEITTKQPIVYMASRERFDAFLLQQAMDVGTEVREQVQVTGVELSDHEVVVCSKGATWRGKIVVGADGAGSIIARHLGLVEGKKNVIALEQEVTASTERLSQNRGVAVVDYGLVPSGYAWVFPKENHLSIGVGSMIPKLRGLPSFLGKFRESQGLTNFSALESPRGWIIPLNSEPKDLQKGRALVIGDAAALADPFTGEGIYAAVLSAKLAAEVITEQIKRPSPRLESYASLVQERMGPELANASRLTQLFYPVSALVHRFLDRHQALATDLFQVIAGQMDYAQFFAVYRKKLTAWQR